MARKVPDSAPRTWIFDNSLAQQYRACRRKRAFKSPILRRALAFCRYADDCNIYVSSPRAAERVMESIVRWIKDDLKLEANPDKSAVGRPWERQFLGFPSTLKAGSRLRGGVWSVSRIG